MYGSDYKEFLRRLETLISKNPNLIKITLSNIFTMRLIGNKTHGDLAEIALTEFINQYMYDYKAEHIGKLKYRSKEFEEDIRIINEISKQSFFISIKAYGHGPLQLSTDKNCKMFPALKEFMGKREEFRGNREIREILESENFSGLKELNILPLIYDEDNKKCNIMIFNLDKMKSDVEKIKLETEGRSRKYPVFRFYNRRDEYICEVRYGCKDANALQRGFWTHTKNAENYFKSLTGGWIDYSDNEILVKLLSHALITSTKAHKEAIKILEKDIEELKRLK